MTINELMEKLQEIKNEYGGEIKLYDYDDESLECVKIQRYALISGVYSEGLRIETDDLDGKYLEIWTEDEEHKQNIVEKGFCVKIY